MELPIPISIHLRNVYNLEVSDEKSSMTRGSINNGVSYTQPFIILICNFPLLFTTAFNFASSRGDEVQSVRVHFARSKICVLETIHSRVFIVNSVPTSLMLFCLRRIYRKKSHFR